MWDHIPCQRLEGLGLLTFVSLPVKELRLEHMRKSFRRSWSIWQINLKLVWQSYSSFEIIWRDWQSHPTYLIKWWFLRMHMKSFLLTMCYVVQSMRLCQHEITNPLKKVQAKIIHLLIQTQALWLKPQGTKRGDKWSRSGKLFVRRTKKKITMHPIRPYPCLNGTRGHLVTRAQILITQIFFHREY